MKPERPLSKVFWFFNGDTPVPGITTLEFRGPRGTPLSSGLLEQARAAVAIVAKGKLGVTGGA